MLRLSGENRIKERSLYRSELPPLFAMLASVSRLMEKRPLIFPRRNEDQYQCNLERVVEVIMERYARLVRFEDRLKINTAIIDKRLFVAVKQGIYPH